jgi:hypothetical protein
MKGNLLKADICPGPNSTVNLGKIGRRRFRNSSGAAASTKAICSCSAGIVNGENMFDRRKGGVVGYCALTMSDESSKFSSARTRGHRYRSIFRTTTDEENLKKAVETFNKNQKLKKERKA